MDEEHHTCPQHQEETDHRSHGRSGRHPEHGRATPRPPPQLCQLPVRAPVRSRESFQFPLSGQVSHFPTNQPRPGRNSYSPPRRDKAPVTAQAKPKSRAEAQLCVSDWSHPETCHHWLILTGHHWLGCTCCWSVLGPGWREPGPGFTEPALKRLRGKSRSLRETPGWSLPETILFSRGTSSAPPLWEPKF